MYREYRDLRELAISVWVAINLKICNGHLNIRSFCNSWEYDKKITHVTKFTLWSWGKILVLLKSKAKLQQLHWGWDLIIYA